MTTIVESSSLQSSCLNLPERLPLARLQFTFWVNSPIRCPEYAGSMLRGAFGHALRRTACMTQQKDCKKCPLYETCPYPQIFETPAPSEHSLQKFNQIPNPYMIEPEAWGEKVYQRRDVLRFNMVLIGQARQHLNLIAYAWQRAFAHQVGHGTAELLSIQQHKGVESIELYDPSLQKISASPDLSTDFPTLATSAASHSECLILNLVTPLRLQSNGKALGPKDLNPQVLIRALARRAHLLFEFHAQHGLVQDFNQLLAQIEPISDERQLHWQDWTRYSSRQNTKMQLGGVQGVWQLNQVSSDIAQLLRLGQWLHIGKETTFGLGRYELIHRENPVQPRS